MTGKTEEEKRAEREKRASVLEKLRSLLSPRHPHIDKALARMRPGTALADGVVWICLAADRDCRKLAEEDRAPYGDFYTYDAESRTDAASQAGRTDASEREARQVYVIPLERRRAVELAARDAEIAKRLESEPKESGNVWCVVDLDGCLMCEALQRFGYKRTERD